MRRLRWWLSLCVVIGLVLAGVGIALWLALRAYGPDLSRERLEAALTEALGQPVRIERVILRPWLGRAAAVNVTVASDAPGDREPLLRLGQVEVTVGISSLWRREVVLSRIRLEDLALQVEGGGTGGSFPALVVPEAFEVGPVRLRIRMIQLAGGHVRYRDPGEDRLLDIRGIAATVRPGGGGLDLTLQVAGLQLQAPGLREAVENLEAEGRVLPDRLTIRALTGRWQGREIRLSGEVRQLSGMPEVDLRIAGRLDLALLAKRAGTPLAVAGLAEVKLEVRGQPASPQIRGRVSIADLTAGPVTARQVAVQGQWRDGLLDLDQIGASAFGGTLQASVSFRPGRPAESRATLRLHDVSLPALEALAPAPVGLDGALGLEAELAGDPQRIEEASGHLRLEGSRVRLPGTLGRLGSGTVSAEASFKGTEVALSRAVGVWSGVQVEGVGGLAPRGPQALRLRLAADLGVLGGLADFTALAGRATLDAEVGGPWGQPEVRGHLEAPTLAVPGGTLDRVRVPFRLGDGTFRVDSATGTLGQSRIELSGAASWSGDLLAAMTNLPGGVTVRATLTAPSARWEDLDPWLPEHARGAGRFDLSGQLEGTHAAWRATGTVAAARLVAAKGPGIEEVSAAFTLDPREVQIGRLRALVDRVPVTGEGLWAWNGTGRAGLDIGPVDLAALPGVPPRLALQGTGQVRLEGAIRAGRVDGSGTALLDGVSVGPMPLGHGTATLALAGDRLQAGLGFPEARLKATVAGRLAAGGTLTAQLSLDDFALAPVIHQAFPGDAEQVQGTVSARATVAVPLGDPAAARGTLTLHPVRLVLAGEPWEGRDPVRLRWEAGRLHVDRLRVGSRVGTLTVSGQVEPSGTIDLAARGQFPLAILAVIRPEVREAAGILEVTARLAGATAAPTVTGEGRVRNASLQLRDYPETLRDIRADFIMSPRGLRLMEAVGTLGQGQLRASGELSLQERRIGAYRFALAGQNLSLAPVDGLQTLWDLDLELIGLESRAQLHGEARLIRGRYTGELSLRSLLLGRRSGPAAAPEVALLLKVLVKLDNDLVVQTDLARLRLGGTLSLEGTTAAPIVFGTLEVRQGQISFRKHRFTLTAASARFTDPRRIDPILDIQGTARIRNYDVTMHLSGRPQDLAVRLSSVPPLPQEDLLTLVTFGVTREEFGQSAAGIVAGEAAQLLVEDLLGVKTNGTGLDVLEVETTQGGGKVLRAGKTVAEGTLLIYEQGLSGSETQKLRLEYQLFGPLVIAGEQDFQRGYGADLLLRLRFR